MTTLAIVDPISLLGEAVREAVSRQAKIWDQIVLVTADPESVNSVTEIAGSASLVQALDPEDMAQWDVALVCCPTLEPQILEAIPPQTRTIWLDPAPSIPGLIPVVAGVNPGRLKESSRIASPPAAVILLSQLLAPLADCATVSLVAHVLEPASSRGQGGLDELFDQTRAILSMSERRPEEVFGTQLAFNLLPWEGLEAADRAAALSQILTFPLSAQICTSQAGVFHCCSVALYLDLEQDPGIDALRTLLQENPWVETWHQPETLGPVATAASDKILLGNISPSSSRGYWLWATMDNLTAAANNAVEIALL